MGVQKKLKNRRSLHPSDVLSCRRYKQSWVVSERSTPEHRGPPLGNTAEVISLLCTITGTGGDKRIRPTAWISTYEDNAARLTCLYVCQVSAHSYSLHLSKSILMDTHTHVHVHRWAHTGAVISDSIAPSPGPQPLAREVRHNIPPCCELSMHYAWNIQHRHKDAKLMRARRWYIIPPCKIKSSDSGAEQSTPQRHSKTVISSCFPVTLKHLPHKMQWFPLKIRVICQAGKKKKKKTCLPINIV